MYDFLKKVPLFADLPEEDLEKLCQMVDEVELQAGEELFAEGSPGDRAYVIRAGQLEVIKAAGQRQVLLAVRGPGTVIGEMALLEDSPRMASVRARSDVSLLAIHQEQMDHLLDTSASAARAMLNTVLGRWRATEALLRQSEKMAQLGTLTAGVAHELNNPAAAVKRGAGQLQETLAHLLAAQRQAHELDLDGGQRQALQALAQGVQEGAARPVELDSLARSDREYDLETWLDEAGVDEAWELAPILVNLGYELADLDGLRAQFGDHALGGVIAWLGAVYNAYNLLAEVGEGARRISEIVMALKSYAYLDQAPVQKVDIHEGLDNTLLILRNKLKSITVRRDYTPGLPKVEGYGSELNQVWTNLIDNAADALEGKGEIVLRTRQEGDWVVVEVEDNGPGIPMEIQERIFDPFFTTKPPGKGTGLGLDISYKIITNKHRGDIKVFSQPGSTTFQVWLPLNFSEVEAGGAPVVPATHQASEAQLRRILEESKHVAVVGLSQKSERAAHTVPAYLQRQGYHIIPVNPTLDEALGEPAYPDLKAVPGPVDVVLVFRRREAVPEIVDEAIAIGAKVVWMQEGIIHNRAAEIARRAGLEVVMDTCMRATHRRLFDSHPGQPG